jgi:hypothetical protein
MVQAVTTEVRCGCSQPFLAHFLRSLRSVIPSGYRVSFVVLVTRLAAGTLDRAKRNGALP